MDLRRLRPQLPVAGLLLAVVGVLMIFGQLEVLSYWLLEHFPVLGRIG